MRPLEEQVADLQHEVEQLKYIIKRLLPTSDYLVHEAAKAIKAGDVARLQILNRQSEARIYLEGNNEYDKND